MTAVDSELKELFAAALEMESQTQRNAFLDRVCAGKDALRAELEELIRAHQRATHILGKAGGVFASTVLTASIAEGPGSVIGPYRLLEQIGEGGFGVVFMAEQSEPVRRKVALKVIKPGMDSRQVIARFEAERQALALMDHPHIAKVLDAGTTESGRPYFVMELVRGIPITEFCDQHQMTVRDRLELFVTVCHAAQHAHQKGIIHRDIKPSNVLVTLHDDRPVVKVIDFGVAKATSGHLTDKTLFTGFMQMLGTPLYMSPEQTALSGVDVDTRSDIYSLGVLLYELLTGTTPFDRQRFNEATIDEMRRIIREEEPRKPSTRLSTIGDTLPTVCAHRRVEPRKLGQLLRGDLDWIVMKALEKDRTRRYETANGFARDVQRYLNDEVVEARPPSAGYRLRKIMRRNKVVLTTAGLVAVALIAGTVVSTWQAIVANEAREETREALDKERKAHREAEENLQRARDAVDHYFTMVSQSTLLNIPGLQPLRKDLMEAAVKYYESLLKERGEDPSLLADLAATHIRVAVVYHEINRNNDTVEHVASAMEIVEKLFREYPDEKVAHRRLAGFWKGRRPRTVGTDMPQDYAKAERTLQKFVEMWERLDQEFPNTPEIQSDLAAVYLFLSILQANRAFIPEYHEMVHTSLVSGRKAIAIWEDLNKDRPGVPEFRESLLTAHQELSYFMRNAGELDACAASRTRAIELAEKLAADFPDVPQYRVDLIQALNGQASLLEDAGKPQEAATLHLRRYQLATELAANYPTIKEYSDLMASTMTRYTKVAPEFANATKQQFDQQQKIIRSMGLFRKGVVREPSKEEESNASILNGTAWGLVAGPDSKVWQPERAVELARMAVEQSPWSGAIWNTLGVARYRAGDWVGAESALHRSMELRSGAPAHDYLFMAMTKWKQGDEAQARVWYEGACLWMDTFDPQNEELLRFRGEATALMEPSGKDPAGDKRDDLAVAKSFVEFYPAPVPYGLLAVIQAEHAQWQPCAESFAEAISRNELDWYIYYERALALCVARDKADYQAACADMLRHFLRSHNPRALHYTAWSCVLAPAATGNYTIVVDLAEQAGRSDPNSLQYIDTVGAAMYRAGRWEDAVRKLMEGQAVIDANEPQDTTPAYGWFFLAMAHQRLQQSVEARKWFDKACEEADRELYEHESGGVKSAWNRRATLGLLRREATAVLSGADPEFEMFTVRPETEASLMAPIATKESHWTLRKRAEDHARDFQWDEAKADAVRAAELRPEDDHWQNQVASLLARVGDLPAYREQCRKLLARHARTTDPVWAERTAKACSTAPLPPEDLAIVDQLAKKALTADEKHWVIPFAQTAAGMAAYRRGEFSRSLEFCDKALQRAQTPLWFRDAETQFVRAMALARIGQAAEAKIAFEKASKILAQAEVEARKRSVADPCWQDFAICEVLQKEAEEVLRTPSEAASAK